MAVMKKKNSVNSPHNVNSCNALWQLSRPRTCLVGVLAYVFGIELTHREWSTQIFAGAFAMFLVPVIANLHNSYTDLEEDARNLPGRLQLVKRIGTRCLSVIVGVGLAIIIMLCALLGWLPLLLALIGALLLLSYSAQPLRVKARPISGLVVFSLVVAFPFIIGAVVGVKWMTPNLDLTWNVWAWWGYLILLFIAKGCVKNVPDYYGDKDAGIRNSATIMSDRKKAAFVAVIITWIAYLAFPLVVWVTNSPKLLFWACPWVLFAMWHVSRLLNSEDTKFLNSVLKWDMSVSVIFLSHLAVLSDLSIHACIVTAICLLLLAISDIVGADSRATIHLSELSGNKSKAA